MAQAVEILAQWAVIIGFGIFAYSQIKRQSIADTFDDIKELFERMKNG